MTSGKIVINTGIDEQANYAIFNMTGICIKKGKAINNTTLNLSEFSSGTYLAQLIGDSQILSQKLIIKK
jgi:hypothetical protein